MKQVTVWIVCGLAAVGTVGLLQFAFDVRWPGIGFPCGIAWGLIAAHVCRAVRG